jgi:hypothetical protein
VPDFLHADLAACVLTSVLQLWIADSATGKARPLLGERKLNTVFDSYTWCACALHAGGAGGGA